jgi:hypothetical protein
MLDFDNVEPIKEEELEINTGLQKVYVQPALKQEAKTEAPKKVKKEKKQLAFPTSIISTAVIVVAIVVMGLYVKGSVNSNTDANANVIALGVNNIDSTVTLISDGIASLQEKTDKVITNQDSQNTAIGDLSKKVDKIKVVVPAAKPKVTESNYKNYKKCVEQVTALKYSGETLTMALTQCKAWLK